MDALFPIIWAFTIVSYMQEHNWRKWSCPEDQLFHEWDCQVLQTCTDGVVEKVLEAFKYVAPKKGNPLSHIIYGIGSFNT